MKVTSIVSLLKGIIKIIGWFRSSLSKKIIIVFSTVSALLVLSLIYVSYYQTTRLLKEDFVFNTKKNLKMAVRNFESYIDSINEISILPTRDSQFMSDLSVENDSFTTETYRNNQLRNLFYSRKDIEKISFLSTWNLKEYAITKSSGQVDTFTNTNLFRQEWFQKLDKEKVKNRYLEPAYEINNSSTSGIISGIYLSYHRKFINIQNKASLGVLSIYINYDEVNKILDGSNSRYNELIGIFDEKDKLIFVSDVKRAPLVLDKDLLRKTDIESGDGDFQMTINKERYIGIFSISEKDKWKMIKLIPVKPIDQVVRESNGLSILIGIIFIGLFFIITTIMSNTITSPLRRLAKKMRAVSTGDFKSTIKKIDGTDEIAHLSRTFNKMLVEINHLINEKYKAKLGERNAQLKALESQINPHFMYNTLQAISTEALEYEAAKVITMIDALAKILRYCFNETEKVTLENELDIVMRYSMLIQARFENRLYIKTDVEKGTEGMIIPRLSIQTVIENAVKHALEKISDNMVIRISAHINEETFEIKISDNGPGIDNIKLKEIIKGFEDDSWQEKMESHTGIGLKNLYSRLKLMYGEKASLQIESVIGSGTEIRIIIPL